VSEITGIELATTTTTFAFSGSQTPVLRGFPMSARAGQRLILQGLLVSRGGPSLPPPLPPGQCVSLPHLLLLLLLLLPLPPPPQYGSTISFYRVALGDRLCDVDAESNTEPLTSSGNELYITCVAPSNEAGAYPFDVRINSGTGLGRASISPSLLQYRMDGTTVAIVQHPDVSAVSASTGGVLGGAVLTIEGSGFSLHPDRNRVEVAGSPCRVLNSTAKEITCVLGPAPAAQAPGAVYQGGRGLLLEVGGPPTRARALLLRLPSPPHQGASIAPTPPSSCPPPPPLPAKQVPRPKPMRRPASLCVCLCCRPHPAVPPPRSTLRAPAP
jgi:hypothetical protein